MDAPKRRKESMLPVVVKLEDIDAEEDDDTSSVASASTGTTGASRSATPVNRLRRKGRRSGAVQKVNKIQFRYSWHLKEDHDQAIFGAAFNFHVRASHPPVFATVGANRVTAYCCPEDGKLVPQFVFADPAPEENFYTVAWSYLEGKYTPILAVAGARGVIRVIECYSNQKHTTFNTLIGHGSAINELKFHPTMPALLISASKDHGLRLWNTVTTTLVAVFGGVDGHRDEVLGVDIHCSGKWFVSCGMDHALKIWHLDAKQVNQAIVSSFEHEPKNGRKPFMTLFRHCPDFTTRDVHHNYVDAVACCGNSVVSKSCEHEIKIWQPLDLFSNEGVTCMHEIRVRKKAKKGDLNIWFLKFSFDFRHRLLAVGDGGCKTVVYDMQVSDPVSITAPAAVLAHAKCVSTVRVTALSFDGDILISTCDDGTIFRWDRVKDGPGKM